MGKWTNKLAVFSGSFLYTVSMVGYGADRPLSNVPLQVITNEKHNVMLMIDNSGSMGGFLPEAPYSASTTYPNCTDRIDTNKTVSLIVEDDGKVAFGTWGGDDDEELTQYDWGRGSGNGHTGHDKKCFDPSGTYEAILYADVDESGYRYASNDVQRGFGDYSGNFLNWYFSDGEGNATNFGAGASEKAGMQTRMEVAKSAASGLVGSLSNLRVGLSTFNSGSGGKILKGLSDIDVAANKSALLATISDMTDGGSTPLAETMETIGRYFIEGKESQNLVLHPSTDSAEPKAGSEIFSHEPAYASGVTKPVYNSNPSLDTSAIQYQCQMNYIVSLTDGMPTSDRAIDDDLKTYASDGDGQHLNDVVKAMYEMDLRPDLSDGDEPVVNNITSYFIGFADPVLNAPILDTDGDGTNDKSLLQSAADNGGGEFKTANNSSELVTAFNAIARSILSKSGSAGSVAFNAAELSADSAIYSVQFNSSRWGGTIEAKPLNKDTGAVGARIWEASKKLDAQTSRFTLTHNGSDGQVFNWANINAGADGRTNDLDFDDSDNAADGEGELRLNYLKGDRTKEPAGATPRYRERSSRLGDIVNSSPVYVGKPELDWPAADPFGSSSKRYPAFKSSAASRTPVLYVGANDGMLHGFNGNRTGAGAGKEVFSYIPGQVYSAVRNEGLHALTDPNYSHRFYVDLTPTVSDIFIDNGGLGSDWMTILVGGLRRGGKGYFALDVTNPANFTAANAAHTVLWEFDEQDDDANGDGVVDGDLGYSYSRPVVAMVKTSASSYKWAVIFGNGYNSVNGNAVLYIAFIEEGIDGWAPADFIKIDTGVGAGADGLSNGLSSPAVVDLDGDAVADRVYAGDLRGNMWAFDISDNNTNNWDVAYKHGTNKYPLFTATNTATVSGSSVTYEQPITVAPIVAKNTAVSAGADPNTIVLFGTGSYLTAGDLADLKPYSFYGVWDNGAVSASRAALTSSSLEARTYSGTSIRTVSGNAIDWTTKYGWYVNLDAGSGIAAGERVVSEALLRRSTLLFNSTIPTSGVCDSDGQGWLMSVDFLTGKEASHGAVFDADNDGTIDDDDASSVGQKVTEGLLSRSGVLNKYQYTTKSDGTLHKREIDVGSGGNEGVIGWQELTPK